MKLNINYSNLIAEFFIVVVGVGIALAADGWRQEYSLHQEQENYMNRLLGDLDLGLNQLNNFSERNRLAGEAAQSILEKRSDDNPENVFRNFAFAAQIGGTEANFSHDVTYRDLITTGSLRNIENFEIRRTLDSYYRVINDISSIRGTWNKEMLEKHSELIGRPPEDIINRGNGYTEAEKSRILAFLEGEPDLEAILRRELTITNLLDRRYTTAINRNTELAELIRNQ